MLKIRQVRRYRHARYPKGAWRRPSRRRGGAAAGASAAAMLLLSEACEGAGVAGPPPVMPDLVTENEARQVIQRVFARNGIDLQNDVPIVFRWDADSLAFEVDGYDPERRVGFEYISPKDAPPATAAREALARAAEGDGPYIEVLDLIFKEGSWETDLETTVSRFIEVLRANGVI